MRILIADDDPQWTRALAGMCRRLGWEVTESHDCFTTLALARYEPPDAVCLSADMFGGNGLGVCEILASDDSFESRPIIMLTERLEVNSWSGCCDLSVFHVPKSDNVWQHIEPLLREFMEIDGTRPADCNSPFSELQHAHPM